MKQILSEKVELLDILNKSEPEVKAPELIVNVPISPTISDPIIEEKQTSDSPIDIAGEIKQEEVEEEIKEEAYISNEIDITAELEKLGLVDLIKKY